MVVLAIGPEGRETLSHQNRISTLSDSRETSPGGVGGKQGGSRDHNSGRFRIETDEMRNVNGTAIGRVIYCAS